MERIGFFFFLSLGLGFAAITASGQAYDEGQYPSMTPIFGVTYSPFQFNLDEFCLPTSTVSSDMSIIRQISDHVRLYGISACPEVTRNILEYASNNDMRVLLGLFLSGDMEADMREINALGPLLEDYASVVDAVIVGNELLFARILSVTQLLSYISQVRNIVSSMSLDVLVTTAEVWPVLESSVGQTLVDALDFVCMNMQPYWEGWDVVCPEDIEYECSSAGNYIHLKAAGLQEYFNKSVWVCEAGWPTQGERCCQGRPNARDGLLAGPSQANASIVLNEVVQGGRDSGRPTYIHAIFDEDWKRIYSPCGTCEGLSTLVEDPSCNSCELDYHFGLFYSNRTIKPGISLPAAPST